ncbi:MAG: biotin--[acetyl-CoA-carboxylase] ligase [Candidatus Wallbacteria bacterium]|nr:biotin--[acetyl-CoA-carboxylase] ligase [Candidatus Wallbacteria bacterium]
MMGGALGLRRTADEREFRELSEGKWIGREIFWLEECGSTNDVARELAREGRAGGTIVAAGRQTAGRGRKGDVWHSPMGQGLWCSFLLYPRIDAAAAPGATLVMARSLVACLRERLGLACAIKEPNDVLFEGRKLAGILAESATVGNSPRLEFLVMGIGVNISTQFPAPIEEWAANLAQLVQAARLPSPARLLAWLAVEFERQWEKFDPRS